MAIDRRQFLIGSSVGLATALWPLPTSHALAADQESLMITACRQVNGGYALLVLTPEGEIVRTLPLNGRGHDVAFHCPTGRVVAFARRPGRFALSFNLQNTTSPIMFVPPQDRHFYGHGKFSNDGRLLFATENDFENARGVIGIYDLTAQFTRIGEFESYGVGPHDMLFLGDGKTLVVANGGIETHPDSGRTKLNIDTMKPSLCFIDATNGDLKARHTLPKEFHQLSVRHLTASRDGEVWFGGQWQVDSEPSPGLVGSASIDQPLRLIDGGEDWSTQLRGYIGSVALSKDARWLAASAPRAGKVVYLDTKKPGVWRHTVIKDASGVSTTNDGEFVVSSGHGELRKTALHSGVETSRSVGGISFDNHLRICSFSSPTRT